MCVSSYEDKMLLNFKLDRQLKSMRNRDTELHIGSIRDIGTFYCIQWKTLSDYFLPWLR